MARRSPTRVRSGSWFGQSCRLCFAFLLGISLTAVVLLHPGLGTVATGWDQMTAPSHAKQLRRVQMAAARDKTTPVVSRKSQPSPKLASTPKPKASQAPLLDKTNKQVSSVSTSPETLPMVKKTKTRGFAQAPADNTPLALSHKLPYTFRDCQPRIESVEDAVKAVSGAINRMPIWVADDALVMTQLSQDDAAAGVAASLEYDDGPIWWAAADEEQMFQDWERKLDTKLALKDGSTTTYLKQWTKKMRSSCQGSASSSLFGQSQTKASSFGCASTTLPGTPAATRPHTYCHGTGGAAMLNFKALAHAKCLPSRQSHKCPGEYGISEQATIPQLLSADIKATASAADFVIASPSSDGDTQSGTPPKPDSESTSDDHSDKTKFSPATESSLSSIGETTFVTMVGCSATDKPITDRTFSADWWRDVVLSKGKISSIADPPAELLKPQDNVVSVLVARDPADHANLFHTMTAVQSTLSALHMSGIVDVTRPTTWGPAKRRISIVMIDTLPQGPFDEMWSRAFSPRLGALRPLKPEALPITKNGKAAQDPLKQQKKDKDGARGDRGSLTTTSTGDSDNDDSIIVNPEAEREAIAAHVASLSLATSSSLSTQGSDSDGSTDVTHGLRAIITASDHPFLSRVVSRPAELVVPPPSYSSTMFAYVNTRMQLPDSIVRSAVYRGMGLWLQQGSRHTRGWRADRHGDGPEMRLAPLEMKAATPSSQSQQGDSGSLNSVGKPICVTSTSTSSSCTALLPRGRVRVLVVMRRPYSLFVEHSYMSRMWENETEVASVISTALGIAGHTEAHAIASLVTDRASNSNHGSSDSSHNQLTEIEALLGRVDLQFLDPAHLSWEKQMALLSGTDVLVGVHGAALTAAALLPPWASLVEIRPKADTWFCFEYLAIRCGIEYFPLLAASNQKLPNKKGDVVQADPALLGAVVRQATIKAMHRRRAHVLQAAKAAFAKQTASQ